MAERSDVQLLREMLALGDASKQNLKELDQVSKGVFDTVYLPSQDNTAIAREYTQLISRAELPICSLIVNAVNDRLNIEGVRERGGQNDDALWGWWQYSKLDSRQAHIYADALTFGDAYLSVVPSEIPGVPLLMPESPLLLTVEHDPVDPLKVVRAAKAIDDKQAWLYTDEAIIWFVKGQYGWEVAQRTLHPLGVCPIVRFPNKLDSAGRSESEIAQALPIQRRINQTIMTRLLLEASAAWRQRWVSGIDVDDDEDGNPIPPFRAGVDKLWVAEDPDTKFGEFMASSTADLLAAVEQDLRHIAVVTQTPPTLFAVTSISNISAESLAVLEGGLTRKVQHKQRAFGEAFEYAMRLGGALSGVAIPEDLEMVWGDYEISSLSQQSNALVQLRGAGLPLEFLLEKIMRLTPQTIEAVMAMVEAERAAGTSPTLENVTAGGNAPLQRETFMRPQQ